MTPPGVLCPDLESSAQEKCRSIRFQRMSVKSFKGLEILCNESTLKELGLLSLKKSFCRELIEALPCLKEAYKKDSDFLHKQRVLGQERMVLN